MQSFHVKQKNAKKQKKKLNELKRPQHKVFLVSLERTQNFNYLNKLKNCRLFITHRIFLLYAT